MYAWQESIVNESGNVLPNAFLTVRDADTLAAIPIYADVDGITPKENPFRSRAGFAQFYAPAGRYQITATDEAFERVYEDVVLGLTTGMLPDLTALVFPIVAAIVEPILDEVDAAIVALPNLVGFSTAADGTGTNLPAGWTTQRLGLGFYRCTHNEDTLAYAVKLTTWTTAGDRVQSAMLRSQGANSFDWQVMSVHDEASANDARTDVEVSFP